ncbi:MAG TPA: AmmeMemoRadiSam system protein A [Thermoanaerobaculia bacterium]|nr:AmmeMemoRadiSam system protein A [Thermoanaerobaculia bacterium]
MLLPEQRQTLLRIARESIAGFFEGRRPSLAAADFDEPLCRPAGAFVTLTNRGELRGCIGSIHPVAPLFQAVSQSAVSAAFRDPRFHPLRADELPLIHLEISVMGPIEPTAPDEVEVGIHGLIISRGRQAGLLLPQVPTEYGWDRETFLQHTCMKAGLPRDAWRSPDVRLERFAAEVFGE